MKRRHFMMLPGAAYLMARGSAGAQQAKQSGAANAAELDKLLPDQLLLKDYRPKSVYKIPVTDIKKAKYPIIDMHHHARVKTPEDVDAQVKLMDAVGVEATVAFSGTGEGFDRLNKLYSRYPKRFRVYCGFEMRGVDQPGFGPDAVKELERCHKMGAVGVGEITDKGVGIGGQIAGPANWQGTRPPGGGGSGPKGVAGRQGLHPDDPKMDALWEKCADLGMPIALHISDPYWSYLPQDRYNDGLMNGFSWRLDDKPGLLKHEGLIQSIDACLKRHPRTVYVCCHNINLDYDLTHLGQLFDRHPNLYTDISARFHEECVTPRFTSQFLKKYAGRICYGTDMPYTQGIFSLTFRIMESLDEHFYDQDIYFNFNYHWPMHGLGLPDDVLKKMYRDSALAAIAQAQKNARV